MTFLKEYSKGIAQVLATLAVSVAAFMTDGITLAEWLQVGAAGIAAVGVVWKAQTDRNPYAKAIVAASGALLSAVIAAVSDQSISGAEWLNIAIATLGAVGVLAVPTTAQVRAVT
jgi:hypothetical protein